MKQFSTLLILTTLLLSQIYAKGVTEINKFIKNIGNPKVIAKTPIIIDGKKVAEKYYFFKKGSIIFDNSGILFFSMESETPSNIISRYLKFKIKRKNNPSVLIDSEIKESVLPLTKSKWGVCPPFNDKMPIIGGVRAYASHIGVAIAQLMKYWKYPFRGTGIYSYKLRELFLKADFNHTYNYNIMPDILKTYSSEEEKENVSQLIYDTSISVKTDFYNFSKAENDRIIPALTKYFGFSENLKKVDRVSYDDNQWFELIKKELNNNRIILYNLRGRTNYDHMAIVDGYIETATDKLIHINLGCAGKMNGYYSFNAVWKFTNNKAQFMIINITPNSFFPIPVIEKKFTIKNSYLFYYRNYDYIKWRIQNPQNKKYFFNIYSFDFLKKKYNLIASTTNKFIFLTSINTKMRKYIIKTATEDSESSPSEEIVFN